MREKILKDIAEIYKKISQNSDNELYSELNSPKVTELIAPVFPYVPDNDEIRFACIERIVGLKEAAILNVLQKYEIPNDNKELVKRILFSLTRDFHTKKHRALLDYILQKELLTPFLRELLESTHRIGLVFNAFFEHWQKELILGINKDLNKQFNGDMLAILDALKDSFEYTNKDFSANGGFSIEGELSDRSYSVPLLKDSTYKAVSYAEFFSNDFALMQSAFKESITKLEKIDEVCKDLEQKEAYLAYLRALESALMQKDCGALLESWRLVDKAWMQISTPLQIGHPLEYYEDHFRKAVAPEWDMRIARIYEGVDLLEENKEQSDFKVTKEAILDFYTNYSGNFSGYDFKSDIDFCVKESLQKTQCYGGIPMLFYGAELNGLFSAQVVPNDEKVSAKFGKKIFYFPDRVREIAMAKPFMQLSTLTFPKDFLDFTRELLFFRKADWYKIYEISTLGHEFGHILWVGSDSEQVMNASGAFKNIEEFKATMGGLAFYFTQSQKPLLKELICDVIKRAVGLIAWKKEDEVLPYYCEGLIHLHILFSSKVLSYNGDFMQCALNINLDSTALESLQSLYLKTYDELIKTYLNKADATLFLEKFMLKSDGYYLPKDSTLCAFVEDYYRQYEAIGQTKDALSVKQWKESYLKQGK